MKYLISNIPLSENKCRLLAQYLFSIVHNAIGRSNGIVTKNEKAACQLIHEIGKVVELCLSPEVEAAVNYVETCIPVDSEDCDELIIDLLGKDLLQDISEGNTIHLNVIF